MSSQKISKKELLLIFEKHSARVDMLDAAQRAIVILFLSSRSFRTLAKAASVNETVVARKLRNIAARIISARFIAALSQDELSEKKIEIIRDHFVNGLNIKAISEKTGLSRYRITKTIKQMRKL
jgi:YesN/AraC family two-component response regulator